MRPYTRFSRVDQTDLLHLPAHVFSKCLIFKILVFKDYDVQTRIWIFLDLFNNLADPDSRRMVYGDVDISISLQNQTDEDV